MEDRRAANSPRAVLWDLDGTLTDTARYHWQAWQLTMAAERHPLTYDLFVATFGQRNDIVLRRFFGTDLADAEVERIAKAKEATYRDLVRSGGVELLPGVEYWLARLDAEGWRQAIASSAPRANIDAVLEALGLARRFGAVVAAEDVARGKPAPDVYLTAAARLGVPAHRCVVVEDAPSGIEGAHRAGMGAIGVRSSHSDLHADVVVDSLADLDENAFTLLLSHRAVAPTPEP